MIADAIGVPLSFFTQFHSIEDSGFRTMEAQSWWEGLLRSVREERERLRRSCDNPGAPFWSGISHKHEGIDCAIVYYFHYRLSWLGNFTLELGYRIWEFSLLIQLRHILRENSIYPKGVQNIQIAGICWWKHRGVVYQCIGVTVQWKVVGSLVEPTCVNWHRICWWLWIWLFSPKPLHKNAGKIPFSLL